MASGRQLDLDGREHAPLSDPQAPCAPEPLFHAPQTIRGQMPMETAGRCRSCDEPSGPGYTVPWSPDRRGVCASCAHALAIDAARAHACPTCGAKPGSPCKRPSGHAVFGGDVHAARRDAA